MRASPIWTTTAAGVGRTSRRLRTTRASITRCLFAVGADLRRNGSTTTPSSSPSSRAPRKNRSRSCRSLATPPDVLPTQLTSSCARVCGASLSLATRLREADTIFFVAFPWVGLREHTCSVRCPGNRINSKPSSKTKLRGSSPTIPSGVRCSPSCADPLAIPRQFYRAPPAPVTTRLAERL
jgi:hypothetical protein